MNRAYYSFHPEAAAEFRQAMDEYESCGEGLGVDFAAEVYSAIQRIVAHPQAWPVLDEEVRRCQTKRFPFGILYAEVENEIFILAVMHLHRDPDYWKHRVS